MSSDKKHKQHKKPMQNEKSSGEAGSQKALPLSLLEQVGDESPLGSIVSHYNSWLPKYQALAQGRSNFQIEKMIATEHATPVASYQHTLFQLRVLHQALIDDFVNGIEKTREFEYKWKDKSHDEPQWWENGQGNKKLTWYDTDKLRTEHEIEELKMSVKDKLLQLDTFTKVLSAMEEKHGKTFTQQELNDEEPEYWKLRLARQMGDSYLDRQTGLGTGNIKNARMAISDTLIKGSKNQVMDFPDMFNGVLGGSEKGMEILNEVNELLFTKMNDLGQGENQLETAPAQPKLEDVKDSNEKLQKLKDVGIGISEIEP